MSKEKDGNLQKNSEIKALDNLRRVVDITRRSRMEASDRLSSSEQFIQNINIYYSCFAVVLSVLSLINNNKILAIISTVLTSILAISIVFLNAQHYGDRAQQFHENFLELYQLQFEVECAIRKNDYTQTSSLEKRYIDLLKSIENHTQQDFYQILAIRDKERLSRDKNYKKQLNGLSKLRFYWTKIVTITLKILIWFFPIACICVAIFTWDAL